MDQRAINVVDTVLEAQAFLSDNQELVARAKTLALTRNQMLSRLWDIDDKRYYTPEALASITRDGKSLEQHLGEVPGLQLKLWGVANNAVEHDMALCNRELSFDLANFIIGFVLVGYRQEEPAFRPTASLWARHDVDDEVKFFNHMGQPTAKNAAYDMFPHAKDNFDMHAACQDVKTNCKTLLEARRKNILTFSEYAFLITDLSAIPVALELAHEAGCGGNPQKILQDDLVKAANLRTDLQRRIHPTLDAYQQVVLASGLSPLCLSVFCRGAAYLLAHHHHIEGFVDTHVDRFLFDFHQAFSVDIPYLAQNHGTGRSILPFNSALPVSHYAATWKMDTRVGSIFNTGDFRFKFFTMATLEELASLSPVATANVTTHPPTLEEAYEKGYLRCI